MVGKGGLPPLFVGKEMRNSEPLTNNDRVLILSLDREFARLHSHYCSLILATPPDAIYRHQPEQHPHLFSSVGECVLRGAAVVEQAFGGITANLWDDPFEWTLPVAA